MQHATFFINEGLRYRRASVGAPYIRGLQSVLKQLQSRVRSIEFTVSLDNVAECAWVSDLLQRNYAWSDSGKLQCCDRIFTWISEVNAGDRESNVPCVAGTVSADGHIRAKSFLGNRADVPVEGAEIWPAA